jgi:hypothetical protein
LAVCTGTEIQRAGADTNQNGSLSQFGTFHLDSQLRPLSGTNHREA